MTTWGIELALNGNHLYDVILDGILLLKVLGKITWQNPGLEIMISVQWPANILKFNMDHWQCEESQGRGLLLDYILLTVLYIVSLHVLTHAIGGWNSHVHWLVTNPYEVGIYMNLSLRIYNKLSVVLMFGISKVRQFCVFAWRCIYWKN